ncbi:MAG: acyl-CoA dehydrogenase family protein [Candidatus Binatia bacterium]
MDFDFSDDQKAIKELAGEIFAKELSTDRIKRVEVDEEWFDRALWSTLASAGLLGIAVDEQQGGMGMGFLELCVLLEELGRAVAPVPILATLAFGGLAIARFGTEEQKRRWLEPVVAGASVLSAALLDADPLAPDSLATTARRNGAGWILEGSKVLVPAASFADAVLVPASTAEGTRVFVVEPQREGVSLIRRLSSSGEPLFDMTLDAISVSDEQLLGADAGAEQTRWIYDRALVAICACQIGVAQRALELTSAYVCDRKQFGVPIGSFQAVQHRLADGYIDLESMRWVVWRAACKLASGEQASREAVVAKIWAAEAASRIVATAQHLHAGIGVDVDYPVHRYFLWSKALELNLGAAAPQLARLGQDMAANPPPEATC